MKNIFTFYPTIDIEIIDSLKCEINYNFSFLNEYTKEMQNLDANIEDGCISFGDDTEWVPILNDLVVDLNLASSYFSNLFGPEGVAPYHSKLGLAVECVCQKSKFRKVFKIGTFNNVNDISIDTQFTIPKNTVNGQLEMNVIVYLDEKATKKDYEESYLNNEEGIVLGYLDKKKILYEGQGALFPIFATASESPKLWDISIDYDDPSVDKLTDTVKLVINKSHKDYCLIDQSSSKYCKRIIDEIMATALTVLVGKLIEDNLLGVNLKNEFENGTILSFIKFLKTKKGLNVDNIVSFSSSVREFLEKEDL